MKFFHTADIHFGVENYGRVDPKTGIHTRLLDFHKSLSFMVGQAIEQEIDFFLFSGDAYKTAYPTPTQQRLLATEFLRLQQAGIPVVIIVGNHDHPLSFGKSHALDVFNYVAHDGFYVFSRPDLKVVQTKSGPVQIVGIPWPARNNVITHESHRFKDHGEIASYLSERISALIDQYAGKVDRTLPSVLAGHMTVSSGIFSGSEKCAVFGTDPVFLPSQLARPEFDYVALGHLHRYQNLNPNGSPAVVYSGSIERVDFGERKEDKSFCSVTISVEKNNKSCSYKVIKLPTRKMIQLEVKLEEVDSQTDQIIAALNKHDLEGALVKILYHLPQGQSDKVDLLAVGRACSKAHYIVGIIPIHQKPTREHRAAVSVHMDLKTLLEKYFEAKEVQPERKIKLIREALSLYSDQQDKIDNAD